MESGSIVRHFLAASVLSALCSCWDGDVQVPSSVTGVIGSCIFVPCQTDYYKKISWYRYKSRGYPVVYSGTDSSEVEEQFKGRTSVPGNSNEGNCTLKINNIQEDDQVKVYVWIWMDPDGSDKGFYDKTTQINVVHPLTWIDAQVNQVENKAFTATCKVLHSCPSSPPKIEWQGLKEQNNKVTNSRQDNGLWLAKAMATFSVTPEDHGKKLSCRSYMGSQYVSPENPVYLSISYAPININIDYKESTVVIEGHDLTLTCNGKSNPAPDSYMWHVTSKGSTIYKAGSILLLKNVRRDTSVTCIIANSIGQRESKQQQLNVHFPPSIPLDSFCSDLGGTLQCKCRVDAKPNATISWIVDGRPAAALNFNITTHSEGWVTQSQLIGPGRNVTCIAQNALGSSQRQLPYKLNQSSGVEKFTVIHIAAGSVVCVVGIVVIAVTAFVCKKKRNQAYSTGALYLENTTITDVLQSERVEFSEDNKYPQTTANEDEGNQEIVA